MYNCKLSHQDRKLNDGFINTLHDEYESVFEDGYGKLNASRRKLHDYLGMTLEYSVKGQVNIIMMHYINKFPGCLDNEEPEASNNKSSAAVSFINALYGTIVASLL